MDSDKECWQKSEKERFFEGLRKHGTDWKKVAEVVRNKTKWNCYMLWMCVVRRVHLGKPHPHADLIRSLSKRHGWWTIEEHNLFREAVKKYGRDAEKIAAEIPGKCFR